MTPEDVKSQREHCRVRVFWEDNTIKRHQEPWVEDWVKRVSKWEFNSFHDGANYKVGNFRFWFKIVENGWVEAGYEEMLGAGGFGGRIPHKYHFGTCRNIRSLQQIDSLFGMMSEEYR